jgi:hypothetical protein
MPWCLGRKRWEQEFGSSIGQFDKRGDDFCHQPILTGHKLFTEFADPAQARRQLDLDASSRGQVNRVVRVKSEAHSFVSYVVAGKSVGQQPASRVQQVSVPPTHDNPPERPGLAPSYSRSVRVDHEASRGIDPQGKAVAPESMHRNGDVHVL